MKLSIFRSLCLLFAIFTVSSGALSQRPNFNRARTYDVQHYAISVSFDHKKRTVFGDTTVELKPLADSFRIAVLDARDLKFESVTLADRSEQLTYRTSPGKITVTLDRDYMKDEAIKIRFKYSATPKKGIYFIDENSSDHKIEHSAQIWTQGQPEEAHHWFPSFDFPSDKATSETRIRVPVDMTVIGNGELVGGEVHDDGTKTIHHMMGTPHPTYLISFVVGKYVKKEEQYNGISLAYYMYPGTEYMIEKAYGRTRDMLRIHEELTGIEYPFAKYDQTIVAKFSFGGMENITATTMADTEIFAAEAAQRGWSNKAAFELHQATERLYHCVLLVCTFYTPHVHNIGFLRTQAERIDPRLTYVWPRDTKRDRARFEKLKEAYVKARYSKHYRISKEELEWLGSQVEELGRVVHEVCSQRIEELARGARAA
ncbi:M1 family aminopeptidase [Leptolyngbya sp. 7M]|uniref:M1 family aminopeptidase n=1 Tax=Leptolyngbya sp. 7M TaxID=2812896 RepID=UPI001B8D5850|nr:M1 family aminopeptidase [Leptolyngbya sp. 7M]QYO62377.1 HEPN domain-containing protein [Leptolyngbya sp. 7M]